MAAGFLYRSLECVIYDRNLAAARKEKARERTVVTAFLYRLGVR